MFIIKDITNNEYFEKINLMGNIITNANSPKKYSYIGKAKEDLKLLRKNDYVKKRTWKIIDLNKS